MEATPDTLNYMLSGYLVFAVVMLIYVASLVSRWNNLRQEQQMLDEIVKKQ
jgi:hypothetical protein